MHRCRIGMNQNLSFPRTSKMRHATRSIAAIVVMASMVAPVRAAHKTCPVLRQYAGVATGVEDPLVPAIDVRGGANLGSVGGTCRTHEIDTDTFSTPPGATHVWGGASKSGSTDKPSNGSFRFDGAGPVQVAWADNVVRNRWETTSAPIPPGTTTIEFSAVVNGTQHSVRYRSAAP